MFLKFPRNIPGFGSQLWLKVSEDPELEAALDESEEVQTAVLDVVHNGNPDRYAGNPGAASYLENGRFM